MAGHGRLRSYGLVSYKDLYQLSLLNYHLTFGPSDVAKITFPHCHERVQNRLESKHPIVCVCAWSCSMQAFMAATKNANNSRHIVFGLSAQSRKQLLLKLCCNPSTSQAPKGSHSRKPEQVRMVIRTAARDCVFDALVLCWAGLRPIISLARLHVGCQAARQHDRKFRETRTVSILQRLQKGCCSNATRAVFFAHSVFSANYHETIDWCAALVQNVLCIWKHPVIEVRMPRDVFLELLEIVGMYE